MEEEYVKNTYSKIAKHFSDTRAFPWPSVQTFVNSLNEGSKILETGCGNGKNMSIRNDIEVIGCDNCPEFLDICRERGLNVVEADIRKLPFDNFTFDATMSIAVIHHIVSFEERLRAINEMIRVTKSGGQIYFQVWASTAKKESRSDKFKPINEEGYGDGDYFVEWDKFGEKFKRFYHLYEEEEIDKLVHELTNVKLIKKYFEKDNWIVHLEKTYNT